MVAVNMETYKYNSTFSLSENWRIFTSIQTEANFGFRYYCIHMDPSRMLGIGKLHDDDHVPCNKCIIHASKKNTTLISFTDVKSASCRFYIHQYAVVYRTQVYVSGFLQGTCMRHSFPLHGLYSCTRTTMKIHFLLIVHDLPACSYYSVPVHEPCRKRKIP